MQTYKNTALGFSISYPVSWQIVPDPWIKQFMGRAKSTSSKLADALAAGRPPFLVAHDPHALTGLAMPAVKCQAYNLASITDSGGVPAVMETIVGHLKQAFPDFELREYVSEYVVAGVVGAKLVSAMSVKNHEGESFHGLTELLLLPTNRFVFSVAFTATSDQIYRPEEVFTEIKRSMRLK